MGSITITATAIRPIASIPATSMSPFCITPPTVRRTSWITCVASTSLLLSAWNGTPRRKYSSNSKEWKLAPTRCEKRLIASIASRLTAFAITSSATKPSSEPCDQHSERRRAEHPIQPRERAVALHDSGVREHCKKRGDPRDAGDREAAGHRGQRDGAHTLASLRCYRATARFAERAPAMRTSDRSYTPAVVPWIGHDRRGCRIG